VTTPILPTTAMIQDMSGLIVDWGKTCLIKRKTATRNAAGQVSAAFTSVGTETLWIQPWTSRGLKESGIMAMGIIDKTTHMAFEHASGFETNSEDRVEENGTTYAYDVLSSQLNHTHRVLYLQQVKRS